MTGPHFEEAIVPLKAQLHRPIRANYRSPKPMRMPRDRDSMAEQEGAFRSHKSGELLPFKGTLEFDFLMLAEAHPLVLYITSRPRLIQLQDTCNREVYRPRYGIVLKIIGKRGLSRIIDVDVVSHAQLKAGRIKFARIRDACHAADRVFMVFTERSIRTEPRLTNAKLISTQAGDGSTRDEDRTLIRQVADKSKGFSLNQLVEIGTLTYPRAQSAILNMVARGELCFPLGIRFDGNTVVARNA